MAKKPFYLIKRRDKLTNGKATYYCRFRDVEGSLLAWRSTGETTKTRAEIWANEAIQQTKSRLPGDDLTLSAFAAEFFVEGRCSWLKRQEAKGRTLSASWARAKRQMLVNHVFPALGNTRLPHLTRPMIERWLVALPLSNQTRNHMLYVLKTVLAEAESEGFITRNPLEHAEPLGRRSRRRDVFSLEELRLLFPASHEQLIGVWGEPKYAALFLTIASTGIREGEARALQWRHVLPGGWLVIEQAVKEGGEIGAPKSGEARVTAVPSLAREVLASWRAETPFSEPGDLVFFGVDRNRALNRRTFGDVLRRALEGDHREDESKPLRISTQGRFLTTHSFRHTYNTMMRRTISADTLRTLIGHRDERMTDHYDHPVAADLVRSLEPARAAIEKALLWW
jgi:integrase